MMKAIRIFQLKADERIPSLLFLLLIIFFHSLIISKFFVLFADYDAHNWDVFMNNFHMSGFDPITYSVLTDWHQGYDVIRHPLLAWMMYPLYVFNRLLWWITGVNCCQLLIGVLLIVLSCYSYIFLYRILVEQIGIKRIFAITLTYFFFGCAYILVAILVPDHFAISLFLLLLTLYRSGCKIKQQTSFGVVEAAILFVLTAGVTLSNGIIVAFIVLITNGKSTFSPRFWIPVFLLPTFLLMITGLSLKYGLGEWGNPVQQQMKDVYQYASYTDIVVENFLGESIQLHRQYLLGDVLVRRPVIVRYSWMLQYVVEAILCMLFVWGLWLGRKQRCGWILSVILLYTTILHFVLGFGLNEVYIMACHWVYVIPIGIGYLYRHLPSRAQWTIFGFMLVITLYLWLYHGYLLYHYLTWPLRF